MNNTKRLEASLAEAENLKRMIAEARGRIISETDSKKQFQIACATGNQLLIDARIRGEIVAADKFDKVTKDALAEKQLRNARSKTASQEIESYRTALAEKETEIQSVRREIRIAGLENFKDAICSANKLRLEARQQLDDAESEDIASRQAVIGILKENLIGKAESAMKFFEENLLPELLLKITPAPAEEMPSQGISLISPVSKNQPDSIFTKIEFKLKPVAALAFILDEVFQDRDMKLTLLNHLDRVRQIAQMAVRRKSFTVSAWAFGNSAYGEWATPEHIEPLREFLRENGFFESL